MLLNRLKIARVLLLVALGSVFVLSSAFAEKAEDLIAKGVEYGRQGNYDAAIAELTRAIELKPKSSMAYWNRGIAYYYKKNLDQAISDYTKAIKLDRKYIEAYYERSRAYVEKGAYSQADSDLQQVLALDPENNDALMAQGRILIAQGEYKTAVIHFSSMIFKDSNNAGAYYERAVASFKWSEETAEASGKDYDGVWEDVHKAESLGVKIDPDFLNALKNVSGREK